MSAKERMAAKLGAMGNAELVGYYRFFDRAIVSEKKNPLEFIVRLSICKELDRRGMSNVYMED